MNVGLWTKTKARWLCVVRQLSNCYCNGLYSGDLFLVVLKQVRNFLVDSSCCLLIKLIMPWFYISAWTHTVLMVKCWWFAFCCPSKCIKGYWNLHAAAILRSVQLQSAMNAYTAFQFQWHLGKHFQASGVSTWWTLSFSCSRLHAMSV